MDPFQAYTKHCNPALGRFLELTGRAIRFTRADGATLFDHEGNLYDDFMACFGALNLGHNPQSIKQALLDHLHQDVPNLYPESLNPFAGALAVRLLDATHGAFQHVFFCNSGTEAVEAALKTAILATGRMQIVVAQGGYHGTTLGALACMTPGLYRDGFDPILAPFVQVPWNDLDALSNVVSKRQTAAFLLEPFQMEGGARLVSSDYLGQAKALCRASGTLLMLDEVQTGMGRTGALFAYERLGTTPDVLICAKSLGGGLVPIGATLFGSGLWPAAYGSYLKSEIHNSTLGGNALACATAQAVLDAILAPGFLQSVCDRGDTLFAEIGHALDGSPLLRSLTHLGLLGGVALVDLTHPWLTWEGIGLTELVGYPSVGALVVERLFRKRILAQVCAHDWSVLRVEPPLVVSEQACTRFVDALKYAVEWLEQSTDQERAP